jgi:N-acetylmuramoyl-L-alanine amidase
MEPIAPTISPRMRREMLRAAVRENVDVREGRWRGLRRGRWGRWPWALGAAAVALPAAAAGFLLAAPVPPVEPPARIAALAGAEGTGRVQAPAAPVASPAAAALVGAPAGPLDRAVFPVGVRRIVLDPGHGGKDVGSVTSEGRFEKDLTLDITRRLRDLLRSRQAIEVLLTRDQDRHVTLRDRARFANEAGADLFVSIHLNWLEPSSMRGVETFYLGPTDDPYLVQLTSRENQESGYALGDVRRLLDGIYLDLRQQESQRLARSVQRSLWRELGQGNPGVRDRGVKSAPFLVLVGTQMPAILAEVSCLSNRAEAELLATEPYRQSIAEALLAGIDRYTVELSRPTATGG